MAQLVRPPKATRVVIVHLKTGKVLYSRENKRCLNDRSGLHYTGYDKPYLYADPSITTKKQASKVGSKLYRELCFGVKVNGAV